jgi:hypothetical protein
MITMNWNYPQYADILGDLTGWSLFVEMGDEGSMIHISDDVNEDAVLQAFNDAEEIGFARDASENLTENLFSAQTIIQDRVMRTEARRLFLEKEITEEEADIISSIFPEWEPGVDMAVDDIVRHNGKIYVCIQSHTTQSDWEPQDVPALFNVYREPGSVSVWVQPTGAHDAYQIGDRVTHNDKTWESTHADNVWEPGVFGWSEAE